MTFQPGGRSPGSLSVTPAGAGGWARRSSMPSKRRIFETAAT
jgi:hypothetical protein